MALEIALGSPGAPTAELLEHGWRLENPLVVTRTPGSYRDYLSASLGEFSVAKHGYVVSHSGWFSERSANYLASGRPVIAQDTGFSNFIECGEGLLTFNTPEEAAADFMGDRLASPGLTLSEFRAGDSRSGEIDVLFADEGAGEGVVRSTLLMRQLGPNDGWFVLAGVNENVTISSPESGATIAPGPVTVEGIGQGQEATIYVYAYPAGDHTRLDFLYTSGGLYEPAPYSATLDLSSAPAGFVAIEVSGATGLENDTGPFAVIPVNIGLPGTR